jgi:hypothetical protein
MIIVYIPIMARERNFNLMKKITVNILAIVVCECEKRVLNSFPENRGRT